MKFSKALSVQETLEKFAWSECPDAPDRRTVVVFRDSFTCALQPFLSSYFRKVYYSWSSYQPEIVTACKPDLVIVECLSRLLVHLRKKPKAN